MATNSDEFPAPTDLPSIQQMDEKRREYGFSKREFSREAGFSNEDRWGEIVRQNLSPRLNTYFAFLKVLDEADPDGPRTQQGRRASCLAEGGET